MRIALLVVTFLAFTIWSFTVVASQGFFGFLLLAAEQPWAAQMLIDLGIALLVVWAWLVPDAKRRGLPAWPYVIATVPLGSIPVLAYLVHRELAARRGATVS